MLVKLSKVKIMVASGHPDTREVVVVPLISEPNTWQLAFGSERDNLKFTLQSFRGNGSRTFKTVGAAVKVAKELGYKYTSVFNPDAQAV